MDLASVAELANTVLNDFKTKLTFHALISYPDLETEFKNLRTTSL